MFGLENLLMQVATTTGSASMDSVVAIVVAVASIATVVGGLLKSNAKTNVIGQYIDTFAQKTLEQEENMKRFGRASRAAVPELDVELKKYEIPLANIEKRVESTQEQVNFFRGKTSKKAQAASVSDLPRENFITRVRNDKRDSGISNEPI